MSHKQERFQKYLDMYEKMIVSIETENADLSICCFKYVNEDGSARVRENRIEIFLSLISECASPSSWHKSSIFLRTE